MDSYVIFGAKQQLKNWDNNKWAILCNTCKKEFRIEPLDGSRIVTNIKSETK